MNLQSNCASVFIENKIALLRLPYCSVVYFLLCHYSLHNLFFVVVYCHGTFLRGVRR